MHETENRKLINRMMIISILYSVAIIWLGKLFLSLLASRPIYLSDYLFPGTIHIIIAFLPFGIFRAVLKPEGFSGKKLIVAHVAGWVLSFSLWALYYYDAFSHKTGGANIGLGILMLFSPGLVFGMMCLFFNRKTVYSKPKSPY